MMRGPIWWFGGKGNMVKRLLPLLPPHKVYAEPFGGGAQLLFAKEPSQVEVYNDVDSRLVNFFRVLRDPEKSKRLRELAYYTPYSREEFLCFREEPWPADDVEAAYRFFVLARMSFSGDLTRGGWSHSVTTTRRGMAGAVSRWLGAVDSLEAAAARMRRVQVEHQDFRELIPYYDTPETLFYLDPPYAHDTRSAVRYAHEMSPEDHKDLVDLLLSIKGMAILSGYRHRVYEPLEESGWKRVDFKTSCYATGRTRKLGVIGRGAATRVSPRVESVWINPAAQAKGAASAVPPTLSETRPTSS